MHFKKVFCVTQISNKISVFSVKQQKLKPSCKQNKPMLLLSTPGCLFFLCFFGSNSLQACVLYLCEQTTGKSKGMASPNLSVQSCHANLFKQRRGPWTLPLRHRRRFPTSGSVYAKTESARPDVVSSTALQSRTTKSTQRNRELCVNQPDNDRFHWGALLLQPDIPWLKYAGVCIVLVSSHSTLPVVLPRTLISCVV